jgi:hypothetical protein
VFVFALILLFTSICSANCYYLENNTGKIQTIHFDYDSPVGRAVMTSLQIQGHDKYPPDVNWCWTGDSWATVRVDGGDYKVSWNGPLIFGNGPNASPSGTYSLNPGTTPIIGAPAEGFSKLISSCDIGIDPAVKQACDARVQCLEDQALALRVYQDCSKKDPSSAACVASKTRVDGLSNDACDKNSQAILANAPPVMVGWLPHPPFDPRNYPLIIGGIDYDQNYDQLFVCEVELQTTSTHEIVTIVPGKILKGLCNWAYNGWGTEASSYDFAYQSRGQGYWAALSGDTAHMLHTDHEIGEGPFIVCRANYTEHTGYFNFFGIEIGSQDIDHGTHVGRLVGGNCQFEWGGQEIRSSRALAVYYLLQPPHPSPPGHPPTQPPIPHPPQPGLTVSSCQVNPQKIGLGGSADLIVTLSTPAPAGGVNVAININSNGAQDTLLAAPTYFAFAKGAQTYTFLLQTKNVPNAATRIVFSAHIASGQARSAELDIQ